MSMHACFVQVPADDLDALREDPSAVAELFDDEQVAPVGTLALPPAAREQLERRAPQVLSQALTALDPSLQDALAERLGVATEDLGGEAGVGAIFALMERRGLIRNESDAAPEEPAATSAAGSGHRTLSLEKAWHGVHYLLCGQAEPAAGPAGSAVVGGTEIGEDEFGYGPARFFTAGEVEEIAAELEQSELERELEARYDPERMSALGIYPGGWQTADREWLLQGFTGLRDFFRDAAARGCAVVTCLL
jgi:Domain of unknown function (DUF1877)